MENKLEPGLEVSFLAAYFHPVVPENPITQEARTFVARLIHSIEQLEIFLTLSKHSDRALTVNEIFRAVQSSEKSIAIGLQYFVSEGVVKSDQSDRFRLADDAALVRIGKELETAYQERHVTIIDIIYAKPSAPIQDFANAFKLRKDKGNG